MADFLKGRGITQKPGKCGCPKRQVALNRAGWKAAAVWRWLKKVKSPESKVQS